MFRQFEDTELQGMATIPGHPHGTNYLFFGTNSSGKSSIGQFLMMLKQTVESPDRKAVFYPGGKNSAVQLGSYQEMVSHRNPKNKSPLTTNGIFTEHIKIKDPYYRPVLFRRHVVI